MLDDAAVGKVQIIFPTQRNLERLAKLGSYEATVAETRVIAPEKITPFFEMRGGERYLCIPDDRGYPVTSELLSSAVRG